MLLGAVCQRLARVWFGWVVSSMLDLGCLVKRKRALRGRNLSRDSRAEGAPRVHRASGVYGTLGARFSIRTLWTPEPCLRKSHGEAVPRARVNVCTYTGCTGLSPSVVCLALRFVGGIGSAVLRRKSRATRRLDSSLRSHRTWRSLCRHVCSGLNKTLFASVGPNSRCRGHQWLTRQSLGRFSGEPTLSLGRIKPGRGHRHDGSVSRRDRSDREADVTKIPPHVVDSSVGSGSLLSSLAGARAWLAAVWCGCAAVRPRRVCPSRTMA